MGAGAGSKLQAPVLYAQAAQCHVGQPGHHVPADTAKHTAAQQMRVCKRFADVFNLDMLVAGKGIGIHGGLHRAGNDP